VKTISLEKRDGIGWITFERPHVRNAISMEMVDELQQVLESYRTDPEVNVLVFTGSGTSFISGGDLEQFIAARGKEQALPLLAKVGELLTTIDSFSKPTIAMINGTALGGGCEFAASCHFRFANRDAVFGFVQIGMHITTGWGGGSRLLDKLPESRALAVLLTGDRFTAEQAERIGFVDGVYLPEKLREEVYRFARTIAARPQESILAYMRLLQWKREGLTQAERIRREIDQCAGLWGSEAHVAVVQRFLQKG
jgi:enoyl-CoA hydratase/carnithine racemase